LLDAARDGCDLHTAEGRSHLSSNAKPLWELLPAGALKQQLLSEIADLVQLSSRELTEVWYPAQAKPKRARKENYQSDSDYRNKDEGYSPKSYKSKSSPRPPASSRLPAKKADHAARILLDNMAALEALSVEDHGLLCGLEAPYGPLFAWLEAQFHEHGAQPWVALREGLQGHESEAFALKLMAGHELGVADDQVEAAAELRHLLNRMLIEQLKLDETQAIEAAKADPAALQRYRELQARRLALESSS
jgi:DNA primase